VSEFAELSRLVGSSPSWGLNPVGLHQSVVCLLHSINTSPLHILQSKLSALVNSITKQLALQTRSPQPDLRLALALLRLVVSLATKLVLWPADATASVIHALAPWIYQALPATAPPGPHAPERGGGSGGAPAARAGLGGAGGAGGGVMGAFGAGPGRAGARRKGISSLSRSSSVSSVSSVGRGGADSSGDDEAKAGGAAYVRAGHYSAIGDLRTAGLDDSGLALTRLFSFFYGLFSARKCTQIRLEALACLCALATVGKG